MKKLILIFVLIGLGLVSAGGYKEEIRTYNGAIFCSKSEVKCGPWTPGNHKLMLFPAGAPGAIWQSAKGDLLSIKFSGVISNNYLFGGDTFYKLSCELVTFGTGVCLLGKDNNNFLVLLPHVEIILQSKK